MEATMAKFCNLSFWLALFALSVLAACATDRGFDDDDESGGGRDAAAFGGPGLVADSSGGATPWAGMPDGSGSSSHLPGDGSSGTDAGSKKDVHVGTDAPAAPTPDAS